METGEKLAVDMGTKNKRIPGASYLSLQPARTWASIGEDSEVEEPNDSDTQ